MSRPGQSQIHRRIYLLDGTRWAETEAIGDDGLNAHKQGRHRFRAMDGVAHPFFLDSEVILSQKSSKNAYKFISSGA